VVEASESPAPLILQVCPNDHPPFRDLCAVYQRAGESLGCRVETIFLAERFGGSLSPTGTVSVSESAENRASPDQTPEQNVRYLGIPDLSQNRRLVESFRHATAGIAGEPLLTICHRYRAYRTVIASGLKTKRLVAVAHEYRLLARWQRRLGRRLFAREAMFAGVSEPVREELAEVVPGALLLPNAIDLPRFDRGLLARNAALDALALTEGPVTIAVLGRLIPWKRPELAVDALRELETRNAVRLVFVGDGPLRGALERQAAGLPVQFAGFQADARRLLKAFDALLIVSEPREAFGMVALEAMAAGVPVIALPTPGPKFVLGEEAIFTDPEPSSIAAAIRQLEAGLADGEVAAMTARARLRAERLFSVAALAARLDDLFFHELRGQ
jgi:glycosyltransferase involved in cell wall biosynthesis